MTGQPLRPHPYPHHPQPEDPATLVLHVAKNRNGRAGESVELLQQGWLARISSLAKPGWSYSDHNENEGEDAS